MDEDYTPFGGLSIVNNDDYNEYYQPMINYNGGEVSLHNTEMFYEVAYAQKMDKLK